VPRLIGWVAPTRIDIPATFAVAPAATPALRFAPPATATSDVTLAAVPVAAGMAAGLAGVQPVCKAMLESGVRAVRRRLRKSADAKTRQPFSIR
jgi:hypothetical protein